MSEKEQNFASHLFYAFGFIFKFILIVISCLFVFLGFLAIIDGNSYDAKDADEFCKRECDINSYDFSGCMESCFKGYAGAGALLPIFILFGLIGFLTLCYFGYRAYKYIKSHN